jgi:hypothetical protein
MENLYTMSISDEIRLALTPVFLLTALGTLLVLLSARLTRCIDRMRSVLASGTPASDTGMAMLRRRLRLTQWAIRLAIAAAILVCLVVISIFISDFVLPDFSSVIAGVFVAAMLCVAASLACLFIEIGITATRADIEFWD